MIAHYTTLVCGFTFFFMGLDFMLRVKGHFKSSSYLPWAIGVSLLFPAIFVIVTGAYGQYGYGKIYSRVKTLLQDDLCSCAQYALVKYDIVVAFNSK